MAILVFVLSLLLIAAGAACAYLSLDLLPTSIGVLYALAGAVAAAMAVVTFALGLLIRKIDRLAKAVRQSQPETGSRPEIVVEPAVLAPEPVAHEPPPVELPLAETPPESEPVVEDIEAPINENRAGHLPTLESIEAAIETPEAPPALIGRYSSGGASYMIFADGSIEAETTEGAYKFASMGDFKRYLADRADARAGEANEKKS
jgi:hypothetical protein